MKIMPSMLAGDFARMGDEAQMCEVAGADGLHLDVMDGVFVPNITFGPPVIAALRRKCGLVFDVHLMITEPERYVEAFLQAGADSLTLHVEAIDSTAWPAVAGQVRAAGKQLALSLKPATPAEAVFPYLRSLDMVLVMTVEPGFGGQSFMPAMLSKLAALRREAERQGGRLRLQVDGGINHETIGACAAAGASSFVAGSAVFGAPNRAIAVAQLREQAQAAHKKSPPSATKEQGGEPAKSNYG